MSFTRYNYSNKMLLIFNKFHECLQVIEKIIYWNYTNVNNFLTKNISILSFLKKNY